MPQSLTNENLCINKLIVVQNYPDLAIPDFLARTALIISAMLGTAFITCDSSR